MPQCRCSFVIPAYNEECRLPGTLAAIAELAASRRIRCEIIIADDGSTDSTIEVARRFHARYCRVRILHLSHRGKGFAIRHGVFIARGETIILCDADLHDSVNEVLYLEAALRRGADIAIGSRWSNRFDGLRNRPLYRQVFGRLFNLLTTCILRLPFRDTQCGLKALSRSAAAQVFPLLRLNGWGYDTELIHVALSHNLRVEEIDLRLVHDYRNSHFRPLADGWFTFLELFKIRWNDLQGIYEPLRTEAAAAAAALETVASPAVPDSNAQKNVA